MTYDPLQNYSAMGAYPGFTIPFQLPYTAPNPVAAFNPLAAAYPSLATAGGITQHQLQLAQILAARAGLLSASPWTTGLNNPLLAASVLQNPLLAANLENPMTNPILAHSQLFGAQPYPFQPHIGQITPQFGQIGSPYGQVNPMLAPQSWVGQPGLYGNPALGQSQLFGAQPYPFQPHIGQITPQFGQTVSPLGQIGSPYGQVNPMLAPQSWVGQPGLYGNPVLGQVHPLLSQLGGRGFHGAGFSPWSGF